ncbi:Modification methylase NgoFVII [Paramyrothecium foliicola]|nr:Modification methylase NgoFVII [Paramyrothecium foliicola]
MSSTQVSETPILTGHLQDSWQHEHLGRKKRRRSSSSASSRTIGYDSEPEVIDLTYYDRNLFHDELLHTNELPLNRVQLSLGYNIYVDDFVEIERTHVGNYLVEFLEVKAIVSQNTGDAHIRGIPFARTRNLLGKLPKKTNEVCKILHSRQHLDSRNQLPLMVDAPVTSVRRKRRLIQTNSLWPEHNDVRIFRAHAFNKAQQVAEVELKGNLVCRWQLKVTFTTSGRTTKPEEEALERIQLNEVSHPSYGVSDEILSNRWRGGRRKGGSWCPGRAHGLNSIDLEGTDPSIRNEYRPNQKYTLFDSFSSAGGVSRGAQDAGLKIAYAVDHSSEVWETYEANFPSVVLYKDSVDGFIQAARTPVQTDFLHLSPPCQYFSPAHTREGMNDEVNVFAMFGCNTLINKIKPRIVTLEQTFGITHDRHLLYLRGLIGDFTQFGYSIRWKIVRLATWGSAQDRKRLIVLAAAPGEKLPPFPPATHSSDPQDGLMPLNTIGRALSGVRRGDDLHDLQNVRYYRSPRPSYDADQLAMTITTGCGGMYYPDGTRDFTLREYASLQGFPRRHQFKGTKTAIKRQIGNAFPPNTVRVLYKFLKEWLQKEDGVPALALAASDIIMIDPEPMQLPSPPLTAWDTGNSQSRRHDAATPVVDLT